MLLLEFGGEFRIRAVPRLDGDHVAQDGLAAQGQVPDEVHGLVPGEFVDEAHGLLAHELLPADDHGVFQAAALDQPFFQQRLDILVKREGACGGQFLFISLRRDNGVKVLRNAVFRPHAGDGNAELLGGKNSQDGAAPGFNGHGLTHFQIAARGVQFHNAGAFDQFHVGSGGAVADGGFVGIHLNDGIINAHARQGGKDMFHGVHLYGTFRQAGGPFDGLHFFHVRIDEGLVRQIHAAELDAEVGGGRLQGQGDGLSRMQRSSGQGGRRADSSLVSTCHAEMLVNETLFEKHEITDFPVNSSFPACHRKKDGKRTLEKAPLSH